MVPLLSFKLRRNPTHTLVTVRLANYCQPHVDDSDVLINTVITTTKYTISNRSLVITIVEVKDMIMLRQADHYR